MDAFKLTLIRHGETPENKLQIIQGHKDTILSERGIRQAQLLAKRLENETFSHVFCSDLRRAQQTCQTIMERNKKSQVVIKTDVRLRERKLGSLEGQPLSSCRGLYKSESKQSVVGMESKQQLRQHAKSFFKDLCAVMEKQRHFVSEQRQRVPSEDGASSEEIRDQLAPAPVFATAPRPNVVAARPPSRQPDNHRADALGATKDSNKTTTTSEQTDNSDDGSSVARDNVGNFLTSRVDETAEHSTETVATGTTCARTTEALYGNIAEMNSSACGASSSSSSPEGRDLGTPERQVSFASRVAVESRGAGAKAATAPASQQTFNIFASALVVSHGGLLMELVAFFVKELKCPLPSEGQRVGRCVIPNAGISRFVVDLGQGGKILPKVICLSVFETDHLTGDGGEDLTPLMSSADCI